MKGFRIILLLWILVLTACEKALPDEGGAGGKSVAQGNLKLSVSQLEQTGFEALSRTALADACSHLNFAVYDMDGVRLEQHNQKAGDADFGTTAFQLEEGTYQLVVLAHSSDRNPTMTHLEKIQFTNATGYSDTFLYHTTVTIGDEAQTLALSLRRIVALCRFVITDAIADGVVRMELTYKGGSGHFHAATGLGVTNSTQVVTCDVKAGEQGTQYDLYTFLHDSKGIIHLTVAAYDAADNKVLEREFDVPMEQNRVTWLTGNFFADAPPSGSHYLTTTLLIDSRWGGEDFTWY